METKDILTLVEKIQHYNCEFQNIEVKAAHKGTPTKLYDTLSSFSNQDSGGIIVFGLDEHQQFKIVGVYDTQDLQHKVAEQCKQMQIQVRPLFSVAEIHGKIVVVAEIPGADVADRPVFYKGIGRLKGSFIRVGEADEPMSDYEIYSYDAYHRRVRDDLRVSDFQDISMLDDVLLEKYILNIKENKPNLAKLSDTEILTLMGILKDNKPTIAGVLCFSKYPQASYPQLCITAVVVPGTEMGQTGADGERFSANKRIEGTLGEMLEEAVHFVNRNMNTKTIIDDFGKRNDKPEYPIKAIREAILNALMHRDYSLHTEGSPIRLVMYKDRLEISNTGGLYGRLTLDSLGKVHSDTRNQTITHILEIQKVAENRFSGIPTICKEMQNLHLPKPNFDNSRGSFTVTFRNSSVVAKNTHTDLELHDKTFAYNTQQITMKDFLHKDLLAFCKVPRSRAEITDFTGKTQYYAMTKIVQPYIDSGKIQLTIPEKPKSKDQRYYTHVEF